MELLRKLQVKDTSSFAIINCPPELRSLMTNHGLKPAENIEGLLIFCENESAVEHAAAKFLVDLPADGLCWVAYPKKSGKIKTDITRDEGWQAVTALGWIPVRIISLDDNWSALRFRPPGEIKSLKRGKNYPGIDREKKTVKLPRELRQKLEKKGLLDAFEGCSYSQRREWVVGLLDAKKEETRIRRIEKIVESLASQASQ